MTDAAFTGWTNLGQRCVVVTAQFSNDNTSFHESEVIPDWAAVAVAFGVVIAIGGFISLWITSKTWPVGVALVGLIVAAIGMRAAERAVLNSKPKWRSID